MSDTIEYTYRRGYYDGQIDLTQRIITLLDKQGKANNDPDTILTELSRALLANMEDVVEKKLHHQHAGLDRE